MCCGWVGRVGLGMWWGDIVRLALGARCRFIRWFVHVLSLRLTMPAACGAEAQRQGRAGQGQCVRLAASTLNPTEPPQPPPAALRPGETGCWG